MTPAPQTERLVDKLARRQMVWGERSRILVHMQKLKPERPTRWTPEMILETFREYEQKHGRTVLANDLHGGRVEPGLPSLTAVYKHMGSFNAAHEAAYGFINDRSHKKDADTEAVMEAALKGARLTELAAERGITAQALGRRVAKYRERQGLEPINLPRGPRKKG